MEIPRNAGEDYKNRNQFPRDEILEVIAGIPDEVKNAYPDHIFEPERIEIIRELALKEFYKLFPFLTPDDFESMSQTMIQWLDGRNLGMAPVHDYWNYLDGMMLNLKLKDIVPLLTSANISWRHEQIDTHALSLYWPVGTLDRFDERQKYDYEFVKTYILEEPVLYEENRRISDEKSTDTVVSRDGFPIVAIRTQEGQLKLVDGNRRTMRAWLYGKPEISAWVGTIEAEPILQDHWIATGRMRRLIAEYRADQRPEVYDAVRSELKLLFESSAIARYHYMLRCLDKPEAAKLIEGLLEPTE